MCSFAVLLLAIINNFASATPALQPRAACNADYCLRAAVRASQFPLRSLDCADNLRSTVTPPTVKFTETAIITESTTSSTTLIIPTTETSIETQISSETKVITITTVVTASEPTLTITVEPRAVLTSNYLPAYASPCSGFVRYSSACSCVGFFAQTIILPVPSTTLTQTNTVVVSDFETLTATSASTLATTTTITNTEITTLVITETVTLSSTSSTTTSSSTTSSTSPSPPVPQCTQAIKNPSFESGETSWADNASGNIKFDGETGASSAHTGTGYARIRSEAAGTTLTLSQTLSVCPGTTYQLSAWIRRVSGTCTITFLIAGQVVASIGSGNAWARATGLYTPATGSVSLVIRTQCTTSTRGDTYLDDITLAPVPI